MGTKTSPARLSARLEGEPSRGLWLVKWLLLVPHLVVLFFLWTAFWMLTVVALCAILFTGRYPRPLFDFNLGVMRWTWRVWCYGYGALATDRYPPFSLGAEPDYPATLDIDYPERLSRGLVLVKWWLLAIPHYLVTAFFVGGGGFVLWQWGEGWLGSDGGLVTLLTVFAGVSLLFTGHYPRGIFDLVMGMNRWVLRVGAYAALMTDEYPPFRLDTGGQDPAATRTEPEPEESVAHPTGWTPARTAGVVVGVLLLLVGVGGASGGGALLWLDGQRDSAGYVATPVARFGDDGYALVRRRQPDAGRPGLAVGGRGTRRRAHHGVHCGLTAAVRRYRPHGRRRRLPRRRPAPHVPRLPGHAGWRGDVAHAPARHAGRLGHLGGHGCDVRGYRHPDTRLDAAVR